MRSAQWSLAIGLGAGLAGEEVDYVEVGSMSKRSSAQPPEPQHQHFTAFDPSVPGREFLAGRTVCHLQCRFGRARQGGCDIERIVHRFDQLQAERKPKLPGHDTDPVKLALIIA